MTAINSTLQKQHLYRARFPKILAERLASQVTMVYHTSTEDSLHDLILDAFLWEESVEKDEFWNAILELYEEGNVPSEEDILYVFNTFNIEA